MGTVRNLPSIEQLVKDIDRLIAEMVRVREQVATLNETTGQENLAASADEMEWLRTAARSPAFAFLDNPDEDLYTLADGKPFHDDER
jgi:hypothetical protein